MSPRCGDCAGRYRRIGGRLKRWLTIVLIKYEDGREHTLFDAGVQVRQLFVYFERRWSIWIGNGRNEFFAKASENGGIIEDVESSDAQSSFGGFNAGPDQTDCLVLETCQGELFCWQARIEECSKDGLDGFFLTGEFSINQDGRDLLAHFLTNRSISHEVRGNLSCTDIVEIRD